MSRSTAIYDLVVATASELGMPAPVYVFETLLVMDRCFLGHKYQYDGGHAMWGNGSNTVEFFDENGKLLKLVAVKEAACSMLRDNLCGMRWPK